MDRAGWTVIMARLSGSLVLSDPPVDLFIDSEDLLTQVNLLFRRQRP